MVLLLYHDSIRNHVPKPPNDGTTNYASYTTCTVNQIRKILSFEPHCHAGTEASSSKVFATIGLSACSVITAKRLTAGSTLSVQDQEEEPSAWGGPLPTIIGLYERQP